MTFSKTCLRKGADGCVAGVKTALASDATHANADTDATARTKKHADNDEHTPDVVYVSFY